MPTSLAAGMAPAEQRSSIPVPESQGLDERLGKSTIGRPREDYLVQATEESLGNIRKPRDRRRLLGAE